MVISLKLQFQYFKYLMSILGTQVCFLNIKKFSDVVNCNNECTSNIILIYYISHEDSITTI